MGKTPLYATLLLFFRFGCCEVIQIPWDVPYSKTFERTVGDPLELNLPRIEREITNLWQKMSVRIQLVQPGSSTTKHRGRRPADHLVIHTAPVVQPVSESASFDCIWNNRTDAVTLSSLFFQTSAITLSFSPFEHRCISIDRNSWSQLEPTIQIQVSVDPDYTKPCYLIVGLLLFYGSHLLATSILAHLIGAGAVGSFSAGLLLVYIVYQVFLPKNKLVKGLALLFPAGFSWASVKYILNKDTLIHILVTYPWLWYVLASGSIVSMVWVYIHPFSERGTQVMSLTLKLVALYCLLHSTHDVGVASAVVGIVITLYLYTWIRSKMQRTTTPTMQDMRNDSNECHGIIPPPPPPQPSSLPLGPNKLYWQTRPQDAPATGGYWGDPELDDDVTHPDWVYHDDEDTTGSCERVSGLRYRAVVTDTTERELRKLQGFLRNNPGAWSHKVLDASAVGRWAGLQY